MLKAKEALLVVFPVGIVWDSVRVLHSNKLLFCSILLLTTLPLSFLTFTLTVSTHALRNHVLHLEAVARVATTRVEARHIWHESRVDALALLRTRALFALLSFPFSLAAAVSAVHAAAAAVQGRPATVRGASWRRPAATAVFVYLLLMAFAPVPRVVSAATSESPPWCRIAARAAASCAEVYLMAVASLGLVVSVVEERVGWEAVRVGSGLMKGRRVCGWVISGLFVLVSGLINKKVELSMEKNENSWKSGVWDKTVLICCYALVVLISYVVTTVFYWDCRKRHDNAIKQPQDHQIQDCIADLSHL